MSVQVVLRKSDVTGPSIPGNFRVSVSSPSVVTLAWDANTDDTLAYVLNRSDDGDNWGFLTSTEAQTFDHSTSGQNFYRMYAIDTAGNRSGFTSSLFINNASVTPLVGIARAVSAGLATVQASTDKQFTSAEFAIPTGSPWTVSVAHGLGRVPDIWHATLVCKNGGGQGRGYDIDDELIISSNMVGGSVVGPMAWATSTLVGCSMTAGANDFYVAQKTAGSSNFINKSFWRIVLHAIAVG